MQCFQCQHENPLDAAFCDECGSRLEATCPSCGEVNRAGAKFCRKCGQALTQSGGLAESSARFDSPQSYTPKHLAEKILTSKAALEGERKQVTVLFADLKGSMELLADRDPEEARKLLDPVLELMMEAVHRYEGTVNQVMGDGIMALFGAPLAHEDHAVRACYAALRIQERVKKYAEEVRRSHAAVVKIRVGLNSGEVVVRAIGNDLHMDYTAVGQTTHLAARMEQIALPGSIFISTETFRLAEGYVLTKPLGERPIKGLAAPVKVYEIIGATTVHSRLHTAAARGLTRFVGRDSELDQLSQALERARSGHGQVVAVVGEPGVGKSRLYWEFTHSRRTEGWLILESSSVSYGKATSFLPIVDLLRAYFQIQMQDDAHKIREKVTAKLLSLDRALESSLPALLWLLDVPIEDPQWPRLDPPQRRQRTLDGVKRLILRESQVQPLLVVFEDLHWIDAETQALLDSLVESLPTVRILLLTSYRPEYQHSWSRKTYYRQLNIDPLPPESAEEMLESLLGHDPGLQPLERLLVEWAEGNPFFLEESVRTLVETKALTGERGAYRLVKAAQSIQIPTTAQAILAARIDRLSAEDKRLLQTASVIGKDVPFALLQRIADDTEDAVRRSLASLQAAEFLYEVRLFPDLEYTFKHALTHEVTYGSLLQERRHILHARIVEAIEHIYADRLAEHLEQLAHHAFLGQVWGKAVAYLRQTGTKAYARSAVREAIPNFERALAALQHLPETRDRLAEAIDVRLDLCAALYTLGELDQILQYLREAEPSARRLNDPRRLGWIAYHFGGIYVTTGQVTEALGFFQSAHTLAGTLGDRPLQAAVSYGIGAACVQRGDYIQATDVLLGSVRALEGEAMFERYGLTWFPAVVARAWLVWALADQGRFAEGVTYGEDSVRIAEIVEQPYSRVMAYTHLAYLHSVKGDFGQALRLLEIARVVSREVNLPGLSIYVGAFLGYVLVRSERIEEGISLMQDTLTAAQAMGVADYSAMLVVRFGEACLLADRLDPALALAEGAFTVAREKAQRSGEAWALHLLGAIASHSDPPDAEKADTHYRQALTLAEELGMRPLVAHCHLGLGKLYRRTGQREQAHEHFTIATTMYREMDMTYWLEKAEAEMKNVE